MRSNACQAAVAAILLFVAIAGAEEPVANPQRSYREGLLTAGDFRAPADSKSSFAASIETDLHFSYTYRVDTINGQRVMRLTGIDVWAVLLTDKSWTKRPRDPLLLDHEQGHFDLTEIHARLARNHLHALVARRDASLAARAPSDPQALTKLEASLKKHLEAFVADSKSANKAYDEATENGRNVAAQALERRNHKSRLEELAEAWETLQK